MAKFQPASVPTLSAELWKLSANLPDLEVAFTPAAASARIEAWLVAALKDVPLDQRADAEEYLRERFKHCCGRPF